MNKKQIKSILSEMAIGDATPIDDLTYAVRTGKNRWSICDNGEEVSGLNLTQAISIAKENIG